MFGLIKFYLLGHNCKQPTGHWFLVFLVTWTSKLKKLYQVTWCFGHLCIKTHTQSKTKTGWSLVLWCFWSLQVQVVTLLIWYQTKLAGHWVFGTIVNKRLVIGFLVFLVTWSLSCWEHFKIEEDTSGHLVFWSLIC